MKYQLHRNLESVLCGQQKVLSGKIYYCSGGNRTTVKTKKAIPFINTDFLLVNQKKVLFSKLELNSDERPNPKL